MLISTTTIETTFGGCVLDIAVLLSSFFDRVITDILIHGVDVVMNFGYFIVAFSVHIQSVLFNFLKNFIPTFVLLLLFGLYGLIPSFALLLNFVLPLPYL